MNSNADVSTLSAAQRRRCAFLDRDGTIIVDRGYLSDPQGVELEAGAAAGLRKLQALGFMLIVISNQSGIGRGLLTFDQVELVNARMLGLLAAEGIVLAGCLICPHAPDAGCDCRKPRPGMIEQALQEHPIELAGSVVIGDKDSDVTTALNYGIEGHLVLTGQGRFHAARARAVGSSAHATLLDVATAIEAKIVA